MQITNQKVSDTIASIQKIGALAKAPKGNFALAKNLNRLKALKKDTDDAIAQLFAEHFGDVRAVQDSDPKAHQYLKEAKQLMDIEVEIEPHKFSSEELNLPENAISAVDLEQIGWLLSDF